MNKLNKISKTFVFLFVSSVSIWLGSYFTRMSLFYRLFEADEFVLRGYVTDQNISGIFQTLFVAIYINMFSFALMIITFFSFIVSAKLSLKTNGWLFISLVLVLLTLPFELYLMTIDYKIMFPLWQGKFDSNEILKLIIKRFTILSGFPIGEMLSYLAILFLFIFQPLTGARKRLQE